MRDADPGAAQERARSFGAHADAYERARPDYPVAAARWLTPGSPTVVVELGAGTGKLTRSLVEPGRTVLAVEPDDRMRAVLAALRLPGVEALAGTAEAIPAPDGAAGAVVSGSAFHWFDLERTLPEVARVLEPGGTLAFAWNHRNDTSDWMRRLSVVIRGDRHRSWMGDRPWAELVPADGRFAPLEKADFAHAVHLPREALGDFLRSYSRVGALPAREREALVERALAAVLAEPALAGRDVLELPFVVEAYRTRRLEPPASR